MNIGIAYSMAIPIFLVFSDPDPGRPFIQSICIVCNKDYYTGYSIRLFIYHKWYMNNLR